MINFDKHLKELLYEEDFIVIPGLGAFIASFTQAQIKENGAFIEPFKTFEFNHLLVSDEGNKFINYILKKENFSKAEIEARLKAYLFDFKTGLNTNNKLVLADVCVISKSEDGHLEGQFIPEINYYTKPSFSDIEFTVPAKPALKVSEPISDTPEPSNASVGENTTLGAYEYQYQEEEESKPWLKYLLYILPVLFIFGALYYVILYRPFQKREIPVLDTTIQSVPDSVVYENDSLMGDSTSQEMILKEIHEGLVEQGSENIKRFEVSAGLFKNKENANKLVDKMKSAGFNAEIKVVNGMRRVYVPVIGIEEAETMSASIEQFTGDKSVYFDENGISNR